MHSTCVVCEKMRLAGCKATSTMFFDFLQVEQLLYKAKAALSHGLTHLVCRHGHLDDDRHLGRQLALHILHLQAPNHIDTM